MPSAPAFTGVPRRLLLAATACAVVACQNAAAPNADRRGSNTSGPPDGNENLLVTVNTGGNAPDTDGYQISIDRGTPQHVASTGQTMFGGLGPGPRQVLLSDVAQNCTVIGGDPRIFIMPDSQPYPYDQLDISIFCSNPKALEAHSITVYASVQHAYEPYDMTFTLSDGEQITVPALPMGSTTVGEFTGLADATYTVTATARLGNRFIMYCHFESSATQSAVVTGVTGASVLFVIACGDS